MRETFNDFVNFQTGTHWGHEVISMLLAGRAENVPLTKIGGMLEVLSADALEKQPSPRLLNCHFPLSMLPTQMKGNLYGKCNISLYCVFVKYYFALVLLM